MLLRVLETGEYRAVGSPRTQRADVRLIAATDRDLSADSFNQPLRRRLEAFVIALPPLRERREDVGVLLRHFLSAADCPPARIATIPDDLLVALCRYDWPGNVRQLRHVASRIALALASDQPLALGELIDTPTANAAAGIAPSLPLAAYPPAAMAYRAPGSVSEPELLQALERNAWCVRQAATALGVSRPSFYALLDANSLVRRAQDIPLDELQRAVRDAPDRPDLWAAALRTPREALRRRVKALGMLSS
jgi:two-component system nitrogen regulation response regulator GlnG